MARIIRRIDGEELEGLNPLVRMLKATLATGHLADEHPSSLFITAGPEMGKSEAIKMFRKNDSVMFWSDITPWAIGQELGGLAPELWPKHLLIPDLLTPMSKYKTRDALITFLNNVTATEGAKVHSYYIHIKTPVRMGLITSVTTDALRRSRHHWASMGFLSRMTLFSYKYGQAQISRVFKALYERDGRYEPSVVIDFPREPVRVGVPEGYLNDIEKTARSVAARIRGTGFRWFLNGRALVKGLALVDALEREEDPGSARVSDDVMQEFLGLSDYMNYEEKIIN